MDNDKKRTFTVPDVKDGPSMDILQSVMKRGSTAKLLCVRLRAQVCVYMDGKTLPVYDIDVVIQDGRRLLVYSDHQSCFAHVPYLTLDLSTKNSTLLKGLCQPMI